MRMFMTGMMFLALCLNAQAGPLEDWMEAEAKAVEAWHKMPLSVRDVAFASSEPQGYGLYEPRSSDVFTPNDVIRIYAEALGYGWDILPNGTRQTTLITDLAVKDADGDVIMVKKEFARNVVESRRDMLRVYLNYKITLEEFPEGDYSLIVRLRDSTGKDTQFDKAFKVRQ